MLLPYGTLEVWAVTFIVLLGALSAVTWVLDRGRSDREDDQ